MLDLCRRRRRVALFRCEAEPFRAPRTRGALDHVLTEPVEPLGEKAVRDRFPVGRASAPAGGPRRPCRDLRHEPRLPDSGRSEDQTQATAPPHLLAPEPGLDPAQLVLASDQRDRGPPRHLFGTRRAHVEEPPGAHTPALPFELEWGHRDAHALVSDELAGGCADEDLARAGRLLEPRRGVHRIAGDERTSAARVADNADAGVHADAHDQPHPPHLLELDVQRFDAGDEVERSSACAVGIVLVGDGDAEDAHDGVADELLDRPPVAVQGLLAGCVVAKLDAPERLGIQSLAERRRAHEVAEEQADELSELGRLGGGLEARPALRAELSSCRRDRVAGQAGVPQIHHSQLKCIERQLSIHRRRPPRHALGGRDPLLGLFTSPRTGCADHRRAGARR